MTSDKTNNPSNEAWDDPIVAEVRKVREAIAAEFDYDIDRIVQHVAEWGAQRRQAEKSTERTAG